MSILFIEGDMFNKDYNIMVNTVNCVGVMGKGVALEFKRRYPNNFYAYKRYCELDLMLPGRIFPVVDNNRVLILNLATKDHWNNPSDFQWIKNGIANLNEVFERLPNRTTIAIPALGCGNGGLDWENQIRPYMKKHLSFVGNIDIDIYAPISKVPKSPPKC